VAEVGRSENCPAGDRAPRQDELSTVTPRRDTPVAVKAPLELLRLWMLCPSFLLAAGTLTTCSRHSALPPLLS